jgi:hypothetical protein
MSTRTAQLLDELESMQPGAPQATDVIDSPVRSPSSVKALDATDSSTASRQDLSVWPDDRESAKRAVNQLRPVFRRSPVPREFFVALQRWEGYVESVGEDSFVARLVDLEGRLPEEEAEFYLDDVSDGDLELVQRGNVFYWNLGYRISATRQRSKVSLLRFRRLPRWSSRDVERVKIETERLLDAFKE